VRRVRELLEMSMEMEDSPWLIMFTSNILLGNCWMTIEIPTVKIFNPRDLAPKQLYEKVEGLLPGVSNIPAGCMRFIEGAKTVEDERVALFLCFGHFEQFLAIWIYGKDQVGVTTWTCFRRKNTVFSIFRDYCQFEGKCCPFEFSLLSCHDQGWFVFILLIQLPQIKKFQILFRETD
jgi:hypothetical protein